VSAPKRQPAAKAGTVADPLLVIRDEFSEAERRYAVFGRRFGKAERELIDAGRDLNDASARHRFGLTDLEAKKDSAQAAANACMAKSIRTPATTVAGAHAKAEILAIASGFNYDPETKRIAKSLEADLRRLCHHT
jgi:hypothetical protein